ncbi:MAG: SIS domain-containing protein [Acidimicrobiales bacterium]|jgi:glutamine---fructose-6-phosphate transaminase (isomerizing)
MTTIFEEEIRSQADILRRRATDGAREARAVAAEFSDVEYLVVAARGSSDNAAVFFQYFAGQELGVLVALATPSLYESGRTIGLKGAGVLAISQSGRTPGLVDVVEAAASQGRPRAVITNDPESPLGQSTTTVIALRAGAERALASTKTFTTTWHALAQLVEAMKGSPLEGLDMLPETVERTATWALSSTLPVEMLNAERGLTIVGRGVGQAVAAEIAIKIREVSGIRAEAYSAADYLHGPVGADGENSTLLLVVTDELATDVAETLLAECQRFSMRTVVLRSQAREAFACDAEIVVDEAGPNWSVALAEIIVGQVLALRVGELRGRPIDTSPGLHKVTLTA